MKKQYIFILLILAGIISLNFLRRAAMWDKTTPVSTLLNSLGDNVPDRLNKVYDAEIAQQGKELVEKGRTKIGRKGKSPFISKFFVCTDCHNTVKEDPDLRESNPDTRLSYAVKNDIPFLQGTTFYGILNRESWYNDDYVQKYGDLVAPAKNNIKEAIQLCAKYCSSGRYLEDWELEAIMAYYKTLEFKLGDLDLPEDTWNKVLDATRSRKASNDVQLISEIKSYYLNYSPADFVDAPKSKYDGYPNLIGNADNGALIYKKSCQTCHTKHGPSQVILDDSKYTFRKLKNNVAKNNLYSIYQIIRYGTHAEHGHMQYMPLYTADRMSDQQIEDLRAYIEEMAG